jgi:hypothetical protein
LDRGLCARQLTTANELSIARLYETVRRSLPPEVGQHIRIYLVDPAVGGGIHLDHHARQHSLSLLRSAPYRGSTIAPIELLTGLIMARFPIGDTVAKEIVPKMATTVRSPLEIPSGNRVGLAQHVIYGRSGMVLQPLAAHDQLWVEAAYPASLRDRIEPQLAAEAPAIRAATAAMRFRAVGDSTGLESSGGDRPPGPNSGG